MDAKTDNATGPVADKAINDEAPNFEATGEAPPPNDFEYVLSKSIQAHGEDITVLRWREPTGADIERAGSPLQIVPTADGGATIGMNERKMAQMISLLANIPPSSVRALTAKDWTGVAWKLFGFFTPPGA